MVGIGAIVLVAVVSASYFYAKYRDAQFRLTNPTAAAQQEVKQLLSKIGAFMQLPTDEEPTVATVTDPEKLKDQPFFAGSQNGDKVLIYTKARKAILYRPSTNKIIDVAPVNIGAPATPSAALDETAEQRRTTAVLRNGTSVVGLTQKVEDRLKEKVAGVIVTDRESAKKKDYEKTIVIDASGGNQTIAQEIATAIGAAVGTFPKDEATTSADILIVVGLDQK